MGATPERDAEVALTRAGLDPESLALPATAPTVTGIDVRTEADRLSVTINGDGMLAHEALRVGERRLVVDIPRASSSLRRPTVNVGHRLLRQIRIGDHSDKVRIVFDLGRQADYIVESHGAQLLVTVKDATAADHAQSKDLSAMAEATLLPPAQFDTERAKPRMVTHRAAAPAFRVRPIQMMTEPEPAEKKYAEGRSRGRRNQIYGPPNFLGLPAGGYQQRPAADRRSQRVQYRHRRSRQEQSHHEAGERSLGSGPGYDFEDERFG
jgi:hypothetical protein